MRSLLAVLAHPDDESMGAGGMIVRHTRADVMVHLVCATRGEQGWGGKPPGARREDLAEIRAAEMGAAATALALAGVDLWHYPDGGLEDCDATEVTQRIAQVIASVRPAAVVTWGPDGGYGHPDHIAVGRHADAAVAAMPERERPALYHLAVDDQLAEFYRQAARLTTPDGESLPAVVADHVDLTVDLSPDEVQMKLRAVYCHQSQLADWMVELPNHPGLLQRGWGHEVYITVPSRTTVLTAGGLLEEFG